MVKLPCRPNIKQFDLEREVEAKSPNQQEKPSDEEVANHNLHHGTYKPWCSHCVASRGYQLPQFARDKTLDTRPVIQVDHMIWNPQLDEVKSTKEKETDVKSFTLVDTNSGMCMASQVKKKSSWLFIEEIASRFIVGLQYNKVILQSDGEPAICVVCRHIQKKLGYDKVELGTTPAYDSQSNCGVENGNKVCAARTRVFMHVISEKCNRGLGSETMIFAWAVRHSMWTYNRFNRNDHKNLTPFADVRGHAYQSEL